MYISRLILPKSQLPNLEKCFCFLLPSLFFFLNLIVHPIFLVVTFIFEIRVVSFCVWGGIAGIFRHTFPWEPGKGVKGMSVGFSVSQPCTFLLGLETEFLYVHCLCFDRSCLSLGLCAILTSQSRQVGSDFMMGWFFTLHPQKSVVSLLSFLFPSFPHACVCPFFADECKGV